MPFTLPRPPQTDEELYWAIRAMFGVALPRTRVCENHVSPFEAVAHAYFGREPNFAVWYASRGSGKSLALAVLGLAKAFILDVDVTILGGSMTQSLNVREHMRKLMAYQNAPNYAVYKDTATVIQMQTRKSIKPLPASQTSARGPHPPLQLLDEVDEMEKKVYDASLGQAMEQLNAHGHLIEEYIVASSTWQNPEGTFTEVMEDARARGMPVFSWCWRELLQPHGWMSQRFIDAKRNTVSQQMWHTEYELNEPNAGSRALDLDKIEKYFVAYDEPIHEKHQGNGDWDEYVWELPVAGGLYAIGADWAKEQDKTVIAVVRYDQEPRKLVKLTRVNRRPWDVMIKLFNDDTQKYQAIGQHDKTGLGNVVNDYVEASETTRGFVMVGRARTQMLLDYITGFEHGKYRLPRIGANLDFPGVPIDPLYRAHRSTTVADVYAPGQWNTHLPDDFAAMSLAHRAIDSIPAPTKHDGTVPKEEWGVRDVDKPFHVKPEMGMTAMMGDVIVIDERYSDNDYLVTGPGGFDEWELPMRFIAALDTSFFGYPAAQGADIDTTAWTRRQILQHLDLGMIAPSQISAGAISDAIAFEGDGVLVTEDVNGKVIVTVVMAPQLLDWLLDVDTTTSPPEDGQVLAYDGDSDVWLPVDAGAVSGATTLEALSDVNLTVPPVSDGAALVWQELDGRWHAGAAGALSIDDLTDVDVTTDPPIEGQALMWDNTAASWIPGSAGGVPGDPGPVCWSAPVPWSSSITYIVGPPASVVTYLGSAYVCIQTGVNHQPDTSPLWWRLLVAKGAKGDTGDTGPASTIPGPTGPANVLTIGTVTGLGTGAPASASITGTTPAQVLNLGLPKGDPGAAGTNGAPGPVIQGTCSWVGPLQVDTADTVAMYNDTVDVHITKVRLTLAGAANADVTVDVKLNGTTMFATAPKPKIVSGAFTGTQVPDGSPVLWTVGSYITCRVLTVGTGASPGRTLTMQLGVVA